MNDLFIRQKLNLLTGLTVFSQKTGNTTPIPINTETPISILNITSPLTKHLVVSAYKITTSVSDVLLTFKADGNKIFPYGESVSVISGVDQYLQIPVQVPIGMIFTIELTSATGGTAILDYLSVIEVDPYDHT